MQVLLGYLFHLYNFRIIKTVYHHHIHHNSILFFGTQVSYNIFVISKNSGNINIKILQSKNLSQKSTSLDVTVVSLERQNSLTLSNYLQKHQFSTVAKAAFSKSYSSKWVTWSIVVVPSSWVSPVSDKVLFVRLQHVA